MSQTVIICPRCQRRTPAARGECIYCGESLPLTNIESAPPQRNIDSGDLAFNCILQPSASIGSGNAESLAVALGLELLEAHTLINISKPLPIARCQALNEAEMICALVRTCGFSATVVADEELQLTSELLRARRIVLDDNEIHVTHSGGTLVLGNSDVELLVLGELSNKRVDYVEGLRARAGGAGGVLDSSEYHSEEIILDVYADTLNRSFRIKSDVFDYSGLISPMSFRSDLNFKAAITKLKGTAPHALVDEDFTSLSGSLRRAWPQRTRNETRGFKRTALGFRSLAQASAISDNRDQFDRYSRLMFLQLTKASARPGS